MDQNRTVKELKKVISTKKIPDADAAVVVLLRANANDINVLFVKRAKKITDPWSGQTGLPGGKRNPEDQNLKQTVIRETLEETSINLLENCYFLGIMEPVRSVKKPEMKIIPFVVLQEKKQDIKLNDELTGYFWVPLEELAQNNGFFKFRSKELPAFTIRNTVIWGLTHKIVEQLLSLLSDIKKNK